MILSTNYRCTYKLPYTDQRNPRLFDLKGVYSVSKMKQNSGQTRKIGSGRQSVVSGALSLRPSRLKSVVTFFNELIIFDDPNK